MNANDKKKVWSLRYTPGNSEADSEIRDIAQKLSISEVVARLIYNRGFHDAESGESFIHPSMHSLHSPFELKDMDRATERVTQALSLGEKITVYGDYDVDGTTAVSLVYSFLRRLTRQVDFYIPERYDEGYGVSYKGIDWAAENHFGLIITLDCGIKANEKVDYAAGKGIDMIICDHHLPENELPKAVPTEITTRKNADDFFYSKLEKDEVSEKYLYGVTFSKNLPALLLPSSVSMSLLISVVLKKIQNFLHKEESHDYFLKKLTISNPGKELSIKNFFSQFFNF